MMPWTHAAFGYVAYSAFVHVVYRGPPSSRETLLVLFAAVLPDLVDKPLAWQFGVLEGGRTLGHSLFVALPLSLAVLILSYSLGRPRIGWAFGFGYLLHLFGDVISSGIGTDGPSIGIVLWPVTDGGGGQGESFYEEFVVNVVPYVRRFLTEIASGEPSSHLLVLFGIWGFTVLLWVFDGMPVLRDGCRWVRRVYSADS